MLEPGDALIVVDVQNDFLPGGSLAVPEGGRVLVPLNSCLDAFEARGLPVFATRDWHPEGHCSFRERGGPWPRHCVAGSEGAAFAGGLRLPKGTGIVSKAMDPSRDALSGFDGTDLEKRLREAGTRRVFVGGLATDYCVRATALDALRLGFSVCVVEDAARAIDEASGEAALTELARRGARRLPSSEVA